MTDDVVERRAPEPVSKPYKSNARQRCATAIAATFCGGSSGLDDMAQAIAECHADACFSALRPGDELPGGLIVVQKTATASMKIAGGEAQSTSIGSYGEPGVVWSAMIAAAKEWKE